MRAKLKITDRVITEEKLIQRYLKGCVIVSAAYDMVDFSYRMYLEVESIIPRQIPNHTYKGMEVTEPTKELLRSRDKSPIPMYFEHVYTFKNTRTGNEVQVIYPYRTKYDENRLEYRDIIVRFRSKKSNVLLGDIYKFLEPLGIFFVKHIRRTIDSLTPAQIRLKKKAYEIQLFEPYYCEPYVDIKGSKESIAYLKSRFSNNLYISYYQKRNSIAGSSCTPKKQKDERIFTDINSTDYISNISRIYIYQKGRGHYLRFELRYHKDFMRRKKIVGLDDFFEKCKDFTCKVWEDRCLFYLFDIERIEHKLNKCYPALTQEVMDKVNSKLPSLHKLNYLKNLLTDNGDKIFRTYGEYLTPKWVSLHDFIARGFNELSFNNKKNVSIKPVLKALPKPPSPRLTVEQKIMDAVARLKESKTKITWQTVIDEAKVSINSLSRNKHLLR